MFKLATVEFPLFGKFDLVLLRRPPSVPPTTIETTSEPAPSSRPLAKCGANRSNVVALTRRAG